MLQVLQTRRSTPFKNLGPEGPNKGEIEQILTAASRVPDHNRLAPWWFVTFEGESRKSFGEVLKKAYLLEDPNAAEAKLELESERLMRAPVVIAVISRMKEGKAPLWEQILSAGAACYNLCLAANALGYGTNWVTEWLAFNPQVKDALGMDDRDNIAGFIYIGKQIEKPEERERPVLTDISNAWNDNFKPDKGDHYGKGGAGLPDAGFKLPVKSSRA
jgi:nitroreductase